eukprot:COSAG02_NODE_14427_length_1274_cov_1.009362_1_plen_22_part_10
MRNSNKLIGIDLDNNTIIVTVL